MIGRLHGKLVEKHPPQLLVDVGGVGYEVDVPMSTFYNLPDNGQPVTLYTHFVVREDAQLLFGFLTETERRVFRTLIKITGVGAKLALSILSGLSVQDLSAAVTSQQVGRLTNIPGIGKKTAERLLLELKGKLDEVHPATGGGSGQPASEDALNALVALGYAEKDAAAALRDLAPDLNVSDAIRQALKILSRR